MKVLKQILRYLLGLFFVIAGINHFRNPEFYLNIMPGYLPLHRELVMLSGVTEVVAGVLLFFQPTMRWGAWGIVAMLVVFFSVHIDMIVHADKFRSVPLWGLYFRFVFQFVLIAWAWWFTRPDKIKTETEAASA
ncbi:MAG: DoxX family membrane protein [Candidatus Hydrogenedentes bacterium]|nr:DoxX family membrane protein [Candidatus Hydrogenedentota bacterium]